MSKNSFVKNASFLMIATLVSRVIGLLYRSPLGVIVGKEGLGYYGFANNVYVILLLISSYSIPMAVSKVISERLALKQYRNAQKVFHGALLYGAAVGGAAALVAFFLGRFLLPANQPNAIPALRVLAPTIFLSAILGVLRGYFQAHGTMLPTSVSQILEQIANAVVSIAGAWILIQSFAETETGTAVWGAVGGTLGTGAGVLVGLLFMLFVYQLNRRTIRKQIARDRHTQEESLRQVFRIIFLMVTPIIFNTFVYNASSYLDSILFSGILGEKGMSAVTISEQWGEYSNYYLTLINIPLALSSATSSAMMPEISALYATQNYEKANEKINEGIRLTMFLCIPAAVGLSVLAFPIVATLFPDSGVLSGQLLLAGSVSVIFSALSTITNGVLQAIGQPRIPLRNAAVSLLLNLAVLSVTAFLLPELGIFTVLLATIGFSLNMCFLNALSLRKFLGHKNDFRNAYGKPLAAAAGMGVTAWILYYGLHLFLPVRVICLGIAIALAAMVYLVLYIMVTGTTKEQMRKLPMGSYLVKVCGKLHLLK